MGHIAGRAEEIAAFLVAAIVGAEATRQGPSSSMDFDLRWPNGDPGVLEVTLVPHSEAIRWQDQLATAGGGWDVPGRWELRLHTLAMPYRATEEAARRASTSAMNMAWITQATYRLACALLNRPSLIWKRQIAPESQHWPRWPAGLRSEPRRVH